MADAEPLGVTDAVLAGFVRVVTHPRIFVDPTPTTTALEQASALRSASGVIVIASGAGYWDAFDRCCRGRRAGQPRRRRRARRIRRRDGCTVRHLRSRRCPSVKVESPLP
ncbi:hypothetical protein [Glaciibacter flavus]|uniref:hypothetical protein n=1 Tax=Orlajensenia flava TaxID=2565934 RepID=UPI003B00A109